MEPRRRRDVRTAWLYFRSVAHEFRATMIVLLGVLVVGTILHLITPIPQLDGHRPSLSLSIYGAWMSLFAQPAFSPPPTWYLQAVAAVYPVLGFFVIGEGIVRFALLMGSRREGEKEWMRVKAATYRDHVVLCGMGHLGYRVLLNLLAQKQDVVVIERDGQKRFLHLAKQLGAPVFVRDIKDDDALVAAGVGVARSFIAATNDDMANLEAALDARRMNPNIRVALRIFDQQLAEKLRQAFSFDSVFSSSALAAPAVAAMALDRRIVAAFEVGGILTVAAELTVGEDLHGKTVAGIEDAHGARVLRLADESGARAITPEAALRTGDRMTVHVAADRLDSFRR